MRALIRLSTLLAFFNFSGIHNGYSAISVSAPNLQESAQFVCSLLQPFGAAIQPTQAFSSLFAIQDSVIRLTLKTGKNLRAFFAQTEKQKSSPSAVKALEIKIGRSPAPCGVAVFEKQE